MTQESVDAIKSALAPVADKIGQGAEYSWDVLVWGQFAEGVGMLILGATIIISSTILLVYGGKKLTITMKEDDRIFAWMLFLIIYGMVVVLPMFMVYDGLIGVIAPEYAALKFLLGLVQ